MTSEQQQTNMDDMELLMTLMVNAPERTKERLRNQTPATVKKAIQTLYVSCNIAAILSDETRQRFTLAEQNGVDVAGEVLRLIAKDESTTRNLFSKEWCKSFKIKDPLIDVNLKQKRRAESKKYKEEEARNPTRQCAACGKSKPSKDLNKCASCHSVLYCDKSCQVKHWKEEGGHKKECKALTEARTKAQQPNIISEDFPEIPWVYLALPSSLTGEDKDVLLMLPRWDLEDHKIVQNLTRNIAPIIANTKEFFKLMDLGGELAMETVGNMCEDAFCLYHLGYKDKDGRGIRLLTSEKEIIETSFSMSFRHYTPVPKGWQICAQDRPFIRPDILSMLERGTEWVRKNYGEREAL